MCKVLATASLLYGIISVLHCNGWVLPSSKDDKLTYKGHYSQCQLEWHYKETWGSQLVDDSANLHSDTILAKNDSSVINRICVLLSSKDQQYKATRDITAENTTAVLYNSQLRKKEQHKKIRHDQNYLATCYKSQLTLSLSIHVCHSCKYLFCHYVLHGTELPVSKLYLCAFFFFFQLMLPSCNHAVSTISYL